MSLLSQLITNTKPAAPKLIVYGQPGVGKTTLAAQAGAVLIDMENGAGEVPNLHRTPYLRTWVEARTWLYELAATKDVPPVVAIDTLDWLILRIVEYVTIDLEPKKAGDITNTLAGAHGGYFKGREIVSNIVQRELFPALNAISDKGSAILLLAHAANVKDKTPEGFDVKTAAPDIEKFIAPQFIEWASAVLYASKDRQGVRTLTCEETNTVLAKNRYGMPPVIPFAWGEIIGHVAKWHEKIKNV